MGTPIHGQLVKAGDNLELVAGIWSGAEPLICGSTLTPAVSVRNEPNCWTPSCVCRQLENCLVWRNTHTFGVRSAVSKRSSDPEPLYVGECSSEWGQQGIESLWRHSSQWLIFLLFSKGNATGQAACGTYSQSHVARTMDLKTFREEEFSSGIILGSEISASGCWPLGT